MPTLIDLFKYPVAVEHVIPTKEIEATRGVHAHSTLTAIQDQAVRSMRLHLSSFVLSLPDKRIDIDERWPADWWQAFKERWFPHVLLRRWPVRYREVHVHEQIVKAMCPHVIFSENQDRICLEWLVSKSKEDC